MYAALDTLLQTELPEVELYFEIGRAICARPEKGAAVMLPSISKQTIRRPRASLPATCAG